MTTTDLSSLKRNKSGLISYPGRPQPRGWGSNTVKSAAARWIAHLRASTSVYLSVSIQMTIPTERVNTLGSALSPMQSPLLPTLEHAQQQNGPRLHRSPHMSPLPPVLCPTHKHPH